MNKVLFSLTALGLVGMMMACSAKDDADDSASSNVRASRGASARTSSPRASGNRAADAGVSSRSDAGVASRSDGGVAPGCYAGQGACEPTNPTSCAPGQACDIEANSQAFMCFDPPNDAQLGEACNNAQGPFCAHGLACNQGTCAQYCCADTDCAFGTFCTETGVVGNITVKVCL